MIKVHLQFLSCFIIILTLCLVINSTIQWQVPLQSFPASGYQMEVISVFV